MMYLGSQACVLQATVSVGSVAESQCSIPTSLSSSAR